MNSRLDIARIIENLMKYIYSDPPNDGRYENSADWANAILASLLHHNTYVFDYMQVHEIGDEGVLATHIANMAEVAPLRDNLLCRVSFPINQLIEELLYLTVVTPETKWHDGDQGTLFTHLTLPEFKRPGPIPVQGELTPRCLALQTIVVKHSSEQVNVELLTINKALREEFSALCGQVDFMSLYQRTLFSMTYALETRLCEKKPQTLVLPADKNGRVPLVKYTDVNILPETAGAH